MKIIAKKLVANFKNHYIKTGAKKAVIGISGGVDSACTFAVAVEALGQDNVLALILPHKDFSREENMVDARDLVQRYDVEFQEIEISKFCKSFIESEQMQMNEYVLANLMSRIRMVILYAKANFYKGIVLGTSNKTEIMTGFFTKYGDGGIDVEVIGSLWKTEVYQLARYFGLEKFADKKPSAELFVNHYDEDEIGVSYQRIDEILKRLEKSKSFQPKTDEEKIVHKLYINNAHKRQMPPVIAID